MSNPIPFNSRRGKNFKNILGMKFGCWTVVSISDRTASGGACWDCVCICGTRRSVKGHDLRVGRSAGCGCARKTSPWETSDPQYSTKMCRRLREKYPEKYKVISRRSSYRKNHGLELEQVDEMHRGQSGLCKICKKDIVIGGRTGAKVDHCHETGKIRGLLCNRCNLGLGYFKDSTASLASAIVYLDESRA